MTTLKAAYDSVMCESKNKHLFENGDITFGNIRDILTSIFAGDVMLSQKVPGITILVTYKDGNFCIATDLKKLDKPYSFDQNLGRFCACCQTVKEAFLNSVSDLRSALSELDPVLLNKYFANGQNYMDCQFIYPPEDCCDAYDNKCFICLNKLKCFDKNFKEVGEDVESAQALFEMLKSHGALCHEMTEIAPPSMEYMSKCESGKVVLEKILNKIAEFVNGVGWGCSINSYIQDKYSRHIINKALEHNLDVSRNSPFVNELVSRLSQTSTRPTKSDLVTFAKREGLDCKSDDYKSFLADLETNSNEVDNSVIKPLENLLYYAIISAARNILGYMKFDPSPKTQKMLDAIDGSCFELTEDGGCTFDVSSRDAIKKNLAKIDQCMDALPKSIVGICNGKPVSITSKCAKLGKLCDILNFK